MRVRNFDRWVRCQSRAIMLAGLGTWLLLAALVPFPAAGDDIVTIAAETVRAEHEIFIRPFNYDPEDPWEYARNRGKLTPGMSAGGLIWNRPPSDQLFVTPAPPIPSPEPVPRFDRRSDRDTLVLGYSVKGIPIVLQLFGTGPDPVLIFAGIHGDEGNSVELIHHLLNALDAEPEHYRGKAVGIIAVANPDGFALNRRTNRHEVDVNRNFPARNWALGKPGRYFGGKEHSSEPETQAIIKGVELLSPARIISIHAISRGRHGNNYDGPGEEVAELMAQHNGYPVLKSIGYPTPGSFGSWAGVDRQIPTITLELPHDLTGEATWNETGSSLLAFIRGATADAK
ncbi:MAG: DUF2817 domain-containing protein [Planctomycetota bacterium]|nr:DUF2817 domain-containing protein [Planctomycetota bacterium]MDA1212460.1 DUF2817 domain-containing protein [Planctomycetota bacterium]